MPNHIQVCPYYIISFYKRNYVSLNKHLYIFSNDCVVVTSDISSHIKNIITEKITVVWVSANIYKLNKKNISGVIYLFIYLLVFVIMTRRFNIMKQVIN